MAPLKPSFDKAPPYLRKDPDIGLETVLVSEL